MLDNRFQFDNTPVIPLTDVQLQFRSIVAEKISSGEYAFEKAPCVVCCERDFEILAKKDRYGLPISTVVCRICGLIQTNPRMTKESTAAFYNSEYRGFYDGNEVPTDDFFARQQDHGKNILRFIAAVGGPNARTFCGKLVAEIGTGAGGILDYFKERGSEVFGVDLDDRYVAYGKKRGLNIRFGTIDDLSALGVRPDLVIYSHVLEHTLDPVQELEKVRGVLKQDGLLYVEFPGVRSLVRSYQQDFLRMLQSAHTYYFTLNTLKNVAQKAGFEIVYGNEDIRAVLKAGERATTYVRDYPGVVLFLGDVEYMRRNTLNIARLKRKVRTIAIGTLKKLGVFDAAQKFYYQVRGLFH